MSSLEELFCQIDDFCQKFEPQWQKRLLTEGARRRARVRRLCLSEILTILVAFHQHHYRNFKHFDREMVVRYWRDAFPGLVSYSRFVEWMPTTLIPLCVYLKHCCSPCTGIAFIDSTSIKVNRNRRIKQHQVFNGLAARGKTSVDWFFGFKLHLVLNEFGEIVNVQLTPGNTDDRQPVPDWLKGLSGKVFADRGYVSGKLAQQLLEDYDIEFFAKPKRNMKNKLMRLNDKLLSRKRAIIETIIDQLLNISRS